MTSHLRARWRDRIQAEAIAARNGIAVKDLRPVDRNFGGSKPWEGTVASGLGWRGFGSWGELKDALKRGRWRSDGMFTVRGEGETQFSSSMDDVLAASGMHSLRGSGFLGIVEADLTDLPFRTFIASVRDDAGGLAPSAHRPRPGDRDCYLYLNPDGVTGILFPTTGLGIGIDGGVPLSQVKRIYEVKDKRVVNSWPFQEWESHIDRLADNPAWYPELSSRPSTQRKWVSWVEGPDLTVLPKTKPVFHADYEQKGKSACGLDLYREVDKARSRMFGADDWRNYGAVSLMRDRVSGQAIDDAGRTGVLAVTGYRNRDTIKARPCPKCWPQFR